MGGSVGGNNNKEGKSEHEQVWRASVVVEGEKDESEKGLRF